MHAESFALARNTLRQAVREYGWARKRTVWHGESGTIVRWPYVYGPGKFEGEHWSIVYFYDAMMNGDGEPIYHGEHCVADAFELSDVEREAFMLGKDDQYAILCHSDQGFESLEFVTRDHYHEMLEYAEQFAIDE